MIRNPQRITVQRPPFNWHLFWRGFWPGALLGTLLTISIIVAVLVVFPPPRTNILILGLDRRPSETTYVSRSDTMILTTINPETPYVGFLSIPRDLYVQLPDGSINRINTAHFFAEANAPGSGSEAAMQTVRQNFGVTVNHYVRLDFAGVVAMIDALGGIELDIPKPLTDYEYPTYDYGVTTVEFQTGPQWLTGERALAYARIRHGSSDFQRAERQELVIRAFIARLLQPEAWPRLPALLAVMRGSVSTDMTLIEMIRLAPTLLRVGSEGLDQQVIKDNMVQAYTTEGGASVQLPVWENINPVLLEMFGE